MLNITIINILIYCGVISYWLTKLYSIIIQYFNDFVISEIYNNDISFYENYTYHIFIINFILFLLSMDSNIYYLILVSLYIVNIIELYINYYIYQRVLHNSKYLLLCLHIILIYFIFDHTSYMSTLIYMTTCLIIGIM
jgi:hypothetical protein